MSETQGKGETPKPSTPPKWVDTWTGRASIVGLTIALTWLANDYRDRKADETRVFPFYATSTANLVQRPEIGGKRLGVTVDGEAIDNLSTLTVQLVNTSGKDFDDVPVEVSFRMADGSPVKLINENAKPERIARSVQAATMPSNTAVRRYNVDVANQASSGNEAILVGQYVFATPAPPEVGVTILKAGIRAEKASVGGGDPKKSAEAPWWLWPFIWSVLICAVVGFPTVVEYTVKAIWFLLTTSKTRAAREEAKAKAKQAKIEERIEKVKGVWKPNPDYPLDISDYGEPRHLENAERQKATIEARLAKIGTSTDPVDEAEAQLLREQLPKTITILNKMKDKEARKTER